MDLRQSTAGQVITVGQALDNTDGDTEENGLTIANTDIKIHKHNTTTLANKNSGGATNISNGVYHLTLNATDTNTAGRLVIYIHVAGALALKAEFDVLTATAFDAKYTGTFNNLGGVAQSADNDTKISLIEAAVITNAAGTDIAADIIAIKAETALIVADTNELQSDDIPALIAALPTQAEVNLEMLDVMTVDLFAEPSSVPAATSSMKDKMSFNFTMARNKMTQTATTGLLRNDADSATIGTSTVSDDTTTFIKGEWI